LRGGGQIRTVAAGLTRPSLIFSFIFSGLQLTATIAADPFDNRTCGFRMARFAKMIEFRHLFAPQIGGKPIFKAFGSNGGFPSCRT